MTAEELYRQWAVPVRRAVSRRLTDAGAIEEAVQDTLGAVVLDRTRLEEVRDPDAWVAAVARHRAIGTWRRQARHGREIAMSPVDLVAAEESNELPTGTPGDPAEAIEVDERRAEQRAAIATALEAMPPELRHAVLARCVEGRSYAVIAGETGASASLVRLRVTRGRRLFALLYGRAIDRRQIVGLAALRKLPRRWRERVRLAAHRLADPFDALVPGIVGGIELHAALALGVVAFVLGGGAVNAPQHPRHLPSTRADHASVAPQSAAVPTTTVAKSTPDRDTAAGRRQYLSVELHALPATAADGELSRPSGDDSANAALRVHMTVAGHQIDHEGEGGGLRCDGGVLRQTVCEGIDGVNGYTDDR